MGIKSIGNPVETHNRRIRVTNRVYRGDREAGTGVLVHAPGDEITEEEARELGRASDVWVEEVEPDPSQARGYLNQHAVEKATGIKLDTEAQIQAAARAAQAEHWGESAKGVKEAAVEGAQDVADATIGVAEAADQPHEHEGPKLREQAEAVADSAKAVERAAGKRARTAKPPAPKR